MDPIIRKFSRLYDLSNEEQDALRRLHNDYKDIDSRTIIVSTGDEINHTYLLQYGWAMVYKELPSGDQQILSFAVPGDFLGLFSIVLGRAEYSIETVSRARLCQLRWDQVMDLFGKYPRLALAISWFGARDQVLLREQVVRIGRQSAFNRTGHIFLELYARLDNVGLAREDSIELPITQEMLADALGLTPIHVSRTLKKLRKTGLIEIEDGRLYMPDRRKLAEVTDFDDHYLRHSRFPEEIVDQPDVAGQ